MQLLRFHMRSWSCLCGQVGPFDMDDEERSKKVAHEIGASLDDISVDELKLRIQLLRGEIERLEGEIVKKEKSKADAASVFKF